MLDAQPNYAPPTAQDLEVFAALVPPEHYLHRAAKTIDFERFRPLMAGCYSPDWGRPAKEPVLLLKLEFLQYHDRLSDRQVIEQAQVNIAYREFLGLSLTSPLPEVSLLSRFRGRLGVEGHRRIFHDLVAQAREHGLVKDRLRLKDATHVLADVAIPATIALVAGMRDRLLGAAAFYNPPWAEGQKVRAEVIRTTEAAASAEQRLEMRVTHLREILAEVDAWVEQRSKTPGSDNGLWVRLEETRRLAHKVLADREHPQAGDALVSLEEIDARHGWHCGAYCGYLLDIAMDADSEFVTAVNVLPANGDEAADAAVLIREEEAAHGNDVEALSADAALFQGEKLRELTDPQGLNLEVFVPPVAPRPTPYFSPEDFRLDEAGQTVTCPAGQQTSVRERNKHETGWIYRFRHTVCAACPLQGQCMPKLPKQHGRSVNKNAYVAEYAAARAKAETAEYAVVRRLHRKVERKLGEIARHHGGRHARFRGQPKVLLQELMTTLVVNVRRMVQILCAQPAVCAKA